MGGQPHTAGPYLLMKRGLYYRPDGCGYTGVKASAGRYARSDAEAHSDLASGVTMIPEAEAPEFSPECFDDVARAYLVKQRDALVEALKKLTFTARTSGGTPGSDAELMAACDLAEAAIAKATGAGE